MANWTRQHFEIVAQVLATVRDAASYYPDWNADDMADHIEDLFVRKFEAANPNFNEDRFRKAAARKK